MTWFKIDENSTHFVTYLLLHMLNMFYICYFQGNVRQCTFSFSGRLEFNSGTFTSKQDDSYFLGYYAMLTGKCLPNSHSTRRNSPEGWLHQHRWEKLTRGSEGIFPKHAIRKVSLNVQSFHSINLSTECMTKPREWFRKKNLGISHFCGGPGRLFRIYKNLWHKALYSTLIFSGFAPRSEKLFLPTFRNNMLLPLPGWQNFIPVDGAIFILHVAQFQSSSQTLDETHFTKEFNTRRPSPPSVLLQLSCVCCYLMCFCCTMWALLFFYSRCRTAS